MMNLLSAVVRPTGLWEWLILDVLKFISNYGLRVVFLIVALKLLMFPIDYYQRKSGVDNAKKMKAMKPEMDKLQEMYAGDRTTLSQKQMQLQRQYKYKPLNACLPMILTLVIFITLFNGFRLISSYQNQVMVDRLYERYTEYYNNETTALSLDELNGVLDEIYKERAKNTYNNMTEPGFEFDAENYEILELILPRAPFIADEADRTGYGGPATNSEEHQNYVSSAKKLAGQREVLKLYEEEEKESFLFVKNIWRADTFWTNPIPNQNEMETSITHKRLKELPNKDQIMSNYKEFMKLVSDKYAQKGSKANGYLVWVVLALGLSFLQQFIMRKQQNGQTPEMPGQMGSTMKIMMWIMPIMMGVFALTSAASFTVYIVVNSALGILTNLAATGIIKLTEKNKIDKAEQEIQSTGVRSVRGMKKK